ncbi:hypothetical protein JOE11_004193 [Robbsia andropogonis]
MLDGHAVIARKRGTGSTAERFRDALRILTSREFRHPDTEGMRARVARANAQKSLLYW